MCQTVFSSNMAQWSAQGFWLGPSLIDGSFQASMALADAAVGIGDLALRQQVKQRQPRWHCFCWEGDHFGETKWQESHLL